MEKKRKKLKKLSDIPKWFDIRKYEKASSLGLRGWYEQIQRRVNFLDFLYIDQNDYHLTSIDLINSWLRLIKTDPIIEQKQNELSDMFEKSDTVRFIDDVEISVRDFTAGDLKRMNQSIRLKWTNGDLVDYCFDEQNREMLPEIAFLNDFHNKPIEMLRNADSWMDINSVTLTANLEASNEQLINDFQTWLKLARINFNCKTIETIFLDIDFNDWCKYAILPYFDLFTWAEFNNSEFTKSIMSQAIFPNAGIDGFCGESPLRQNSCRLKF